MDDFNSLQQARVESSILNTDPHIHAGLHVDVLQSQLYYACRYHSEDRTLANLDQQGKSRSAKEVLRRIDYGGSLTLLVTVCGLVFSCRILLKMILGWLSLVLLGHKV